MAQSLRVRDFSLRHTLECGQVFRWRRLEDGGYVVRRREAEFRVRQEGDRLLFDGVPAEYVRDFFSLDHDFRAIAASIDRDAWIHAAIKRYWGLRLVRQDPWECTAAFITSIASNIPRITRNLNDIASRLGFRGQFPLAGSMGDEPTLRGLRLGFRAKYLVDAARLVNAGLLDDAFGLPAAEARETLMVMPGVAEKVADCVLLYAFGHLDAFPVDTWIRKVVRKVYFEDRRVTDGHIRQFAARYFGRYAGYAQQYLYVYSRENWKTVAELRTPKSDTAMIRSLAAKVLARREPDRMVYRLVQT